MKKLKSIKNIDLSLLDQKLSKFNRHTYQRPPPLNKISISDTIHPQINKYPNQISNTLKVSEFRTIYFKNKNLNNSKKSKKEFNLSDNHQINCNNFNLSIKEIKKIPVQNECNKKNILEYKSKVNFFSSSRLAKLYKSKHKIENSNLDDFKTTNYIKYKNSKKFNKLYYDNYDKNSNVTEKIGEKYTSCNTNFSHNELKDSEKKYRTENNNLDINNSENEELTELLKIPDNITENNNKFKLNIKFEQLIIKIINNKYRKSMLKYYINKWYERVFFEQDVIDLGNSPIDKKATFSMGDYLRISDIYGLKKRKKKNFKSLQFNSNNDTRNFIDNNFTGYFNQTDHNRQNNYLFNLTNGEIIKNTNKKKYSGHSKKLSCISKLHRNSASEKKKKNLTVNYCKKYKFVERNSSKEKRMFIKLDFSK